MKYFYILLPVLLVLQGGLLFAQPCPPVGFPDPGNTCPEAPILCENLDGYCATINNNNGPQPFPGCSGQWTLNNDEWFAFFAGTTEIVIEVTPSNCSQGPGQEGLQGGIYAGCPPGVQIMDLQCSCTQNPFILESDDYVVGQVYWFVLDGCGGNVCDYSIEVLEGSTVSVPPADPGPITGPTTVCQNTTNNYSITPPNAATVYIWTLTPSNLGTINGSTNSVNVNWGNMAGTAELCVQVGNLCDTNPTLSCQMIDIQPVPTATLSGSGIICESEPEPVDLTITFTGDPPWEFIYRRNGVPQPPIVTSDNPYILTVTQPGTYTLQSVLSDDGNCPGTVSGSVTINQVVINPTAVVTNAVCGQSNGAINLSVTGGNTPYTYVWDNGPTTQDQSNLPAGSYTVTITDANGCTESLVVTVADDPFPFTITGNTTPNTTCLPGGNGDIDITVNPANTYTYIWSNGATTPDLTDVPPGSYTVTVTFGVNCTQEATFDIEDEPNEPNINTSFVGTTCDLSNGSVSISVTGGVPPYTILWGGGQTTSTISNIPAGSYSVTVTGANACTAEATIDVPNNNPPFNVNAVVAPNTTCLPGGNGAINITVTPANTYTFTWSHGPTTEDVNNLPPGSYTVTVSAGGSCTDEFSFDIPDEPNEPVVNGNPTQSTCDLANGSITTSISSSFPPYTYLWDNGANTPNLNNLLAGTYTVTVTGANGCSTVQSFTVDNNNPPFNINANIQPNTSCLPPGNGSITVTVTPANTYTYTWSSGQTTPGINNQPPGSYTVTVSAGGSCTDEATFDIPDEPNEPIIFIDETPSTCELSNGAINITVSGGVTPYTYNWSNGATTQDLSGILAGPYSLTVTGANGCTAVDFVDLTNNNIAIDINGTVTPNTNCLTNGNGSIVIAVQPQPGAYTYTWNTGATTQNINGLSPGSYSVTVSLGGACTAEASFDVPDEPFTPELSFVATDPNCGLSNGNINLTVNAGLPPYTYLWSSGQTTQDINNQPPGFYFVTVTGANGCTSVDGIELTNQVIDITVLEDVFNQTSCVTNNGRINLFVTPSNATFLWSNGATTPNLINITAGVYSVTVSAGGDCTQTLTYVVGDDREYPSIIGDLTNATCGFSNGSIFTLVSGAPGPYSYNWSPSGSGPDRENIPAGNYSVTVTSSLGCTATELFAIENEPILINIAGFPADNISCTTPNGFIDIDVDPPGTYTYAWSNGRTTQDINNLPAGVYTVTVTRGTCSATATFEVFNQLSLPNANTAPSPATCGQSNGGVALSANGGFPPYTYLWTGGATTQNLNNVPPGTYNVTVTDFYGCTTTATATVPNSFITPNIAGQSAPNTSCTAPNGSINITATPAGLAFVYAWSNMSSSEDPGNLAPGTYTVTVSVGTGCTSSATFTVTDSTSLPVIDAVVTPSICSQSDGGINLSISGGTGPYTFNWSNMASSEDLTNILAGNYTVTVTDATGCTADSLFNVPNNSSTFSISGVATPVTSCTTINGAIDLTVTPAGPYTYQWSNMATTQDLANLPPGTYDVTVVETGTCAASASFVIADNRTYPAANTNVTPEICGLTNGSIDLTVTGGATPYTYMWSNAAGTEDLTGIDAGPYTVTVTGANRCTGTATANVPEEFIVFALSGNPVPNSSCVAANGSIDLVVTPSGTYTYNWSNAAATQDLNNITGGTYSVTVSAGGTCTNTATFTVSSTIPAPVISESVAPEVCGQGNGSINLSVGGGAGPYGFIWSNAAVTEDLSGLLAGAYAVTVTGANGCSTTENYTVPTSTIIPVINSAITANTSCTAPNGAVNLAVTPTNLTYQYNWSGGQNTPAVSGLPVGTYSVTVNGGGACTATADFVVPDNRDVPVIDGQITNVLCFGDLTGAIEQNVTGGTPPFSFNWSPSITGNPEDPAGLAAGVYQVTITDPLGCTATQTYAITQPATAVSLVCVQTATVTFPGLSDGIATLTISGGTPPYVVSTTPGATQSGVQPGDLVFNSLSEGQYAVVVTDANGCPITCDFRITPEICETVIGNMSDALLENCGPGCLEATYDALGQFLDPDDVLQFILHEGSGAQIVNEIARSNQPEFCFDPATMQYGTTYYIAAVAGDNDGNGNVALNDYCTVIAAGTPILFKEIPVPVIAPPGNLNCVVDAVTLSGSSSINATFSWTTGNGTLAGDPSQASVQATSEGTYTLTLDANGCTAATAVLVNDFTNQPTATVIASPDDVLDCKINEIILAGTIEGSLDANAIWLSGGMVFANGTTVTIDTPGAYVFVILDTISLCTDTAFVDIDEDQAFPPLFINPPAILSCTNTSITLSGGSPIPGVTFNWVQVIGTDTVPVGSGPSVPVTQPGTYVLIGVDPVNNCNNSTEVAVIAVLDAPVADAGQGFTIACFGETELLDGTASTGEPGLLFMWSSADGIVASGAGTATPTISQPGTYTLVVTNPGNGCTDVAEVVIPPDAPIAILEVIQPPCEGDKGVIRIDTFIGGKPPVQYSFDGGVTFTQATVFNNLSAGVYSILAVDAIGCSATVEATIVDAQPFLLTLDPRVYLKLGDSYLINTVSTIQANLIGSIQWTPSTGLSCDTCLNPLATPPRTQQYRVVAVSQAGCRAEAGILLIVDRDIDVYVPNVFSPNNDGENDWFTVYANPKHVINIKALQIFDRWGNMVFQRTDFPPNQNEMGWDGSHRGDAMNPAVFVWYAELELADGTVELFKGDVTLTR